MSGPIFTTRAGRSLALRELGLGTAPLGNMFRSLKEEEVFETIDSAWQSGMRYFDTAPLYGHGLAELRLGRALQSRSGFVVSTKVGRVLEACNSGEEESGIYVSTPNKRVRFDYSFDGIMRSFEDSRERLGLERIDIVFVHDVDARTHGGVSQSEERIRELIDRGGWRALSELRAAGVVTAIGAGVNEWQPCLRLLELVDPDLFLLAGRYTLLEQEPLRTLFPRCMERGVGIVTGGVFNSGVLAGKPSYDYASVPPAIAARAKTIATICRDFGVAVPAAALGFSRAHPAVACVLVGCQAASEVRANAAHATAFIPDGLWDELKKSGLIDAEAPVPASRREASGALS